MPRPVPKLTNEDEKRHRKKKKRTWGEWVYDELQSAAAETGIGLAVQGLAPGYGLAAVAALRASRLADSMIEGGKKDTSQLTKKQRVEDIDAPQTPAQRKRPRTELSDASDYWNEHLDKVPRRALKPSPAVKPSAKSKSGGMPAKLTKAQLARIAANKKKAKARFAKLPAAKRKKAMKIYRKAAKPRKVVKKGTKFTTLKSVIGPRMNHTVKYETHGAIQRDDISYFGFQSCGGYAEVQGRVAEALIRTICRKCKIQIRNPDDTLTLTASDSSVRSFRISYRRNNWTDPSDGSGGMTDTSEHTFNGQTFKEVVESLRSAMFTRAEGGYIPYAFTACNLSTFNTATSTHVFFDLKFGEAKLRLSTKIAVKLRNITPNDKGDSDLTTSDTNPLQGKLYKFRGDAPSIKSDLYGTASTNGTGRPQYLAFQDQVVSRGVQPGPQGTSGSANIGLFSDDKILSTPFVARSLFTNVISEQRITMPVGKTMLHRLAWSYNGTLENFILKFSQANYKRRAIGTCHWLGLEQMYKQKGLYANNLDDGTQHNHVTVEYDLDTSMSGGATFAPAERSMNEVVTTDINMIMT